MTHITVKVDAKINSPRKREIIVHLTKNIHKSTTYSTLNAFVKVFIVFCTTQLQCREMAEVEKVWLVCVSQILCNLSLHSRASVTYEKERLVSKVKRSWNVNINKHHICLGAVL